MSGKRGTRWSPVGTGSFPFAVSVASGDPSGTGKRHIATLQKVRLTAARGPWHVNEVTVTWKVTVTSYI